MVPLIWSLREAGGARVGERSASIILAGASRATRHLPAISLPASGTPGIHRTREARERRGSLAVLSQASARTAAPAPRPPPAPPPRPRHPRRPPGLPPPPPR